MVINLTEEKYKIYIDGKWNLEDLYVFPHAYEQVYFLIYSLLPHENEQIQEKIKHAYSAFPWRGGYSAVNFYNKLKYTISKQNRPQVLSMQYASPEWIELMLIVSVAIVLERIVKSISVSIREANATYNDIYRGLSERKLLRIETKKKEIELEKQHMEYIQSSSHQMSKLLGFDSIEQMHKKSGSPLKTVKILLSLYRRVRTLVEFQNCGKTKL